MLNLVSLYPYLDGARHNSGLMIVHEVSISLMCHNNHGGLSDGTNHNVSGVWACWTIR